MHWLDWVIVALFGLVFAYVLARTVSFAYFRTKAEYLRDLMKKEDNNG